MPPFTEASDAEPPSRWEEAIAEPAQTSESAEEHARLEHTYLEHPHWADTELPREIALPAEGAKERNLRRTSITIRMSSEENLQLRKRAAEAGLTVSAYLRSCTFEAESLRALVKDTLAQLRASAETKNGRKAAKPRHRWRDWMNLLWSHDEDGEQISGL
jgi:predicted DNA binding CopG/RHH family protein